MTLKECYAAMGGDYDEAIGRLRSEKLVEKFVDENPEAAANLLRNWLNEDWS